MFPLIRFQNPTPSGSAGIRGVRSAESLLASLCLTVHIALGISIHNPFPLCLFSPGFSCLMSTKPARLLRDPQLQKQAGVDFKSVENFRSESNGKKKKKSWYVTLGLCCSHQAHSIHPVCGYPVCMDLCVHRSLCVHCSHCGYGILCVHSSHCVCAQIPTMSLSFCSSYCVHRSSFVYSLLCMDPYVCIHYLYVYRHLCV